MPLSFLVIGMIIAVVFVNFIIPLLVENTVDSYSSDIYHPRDITVLNKTDTIIKTYGGTDCYIIETNVGTFEAPMEVYSRLQENKPYVVNVWGTFILDIISEVEEE